MTLEAYATLLTVGHHFGQREKDSSVAWKLCMLPMWLAAWYYHFFAANVASNTPHPKSIFYENTKMLTVVILFTVFGLI